MSAAIWIGGVALLLLLAGWRLARAARTVRRILAEEIERAEPETVVAEPIVRDAGPRCQ